MIAQVESQVKPQFSYIVATEMKVTQDAQGEEVKNYTVSTSLGLYCESSQVMDICGERYCNCPEYSHNAARGFWTCVHVAAVQIALASGEPIEETPIPFEEKPGGAEPGEFDGPPLF